MDKMATGTSPRLGFCYVFWHSGVIKETAVNYCPWLVFCGPDVTKRNPRGFSVMLQSRWEEG